MCFFFSYFPWYFHTPLVIIFSYVYLMLFSVQVLVEETWVYQGWQFYISRLCLTLHGIN